jgi:hypothetical protein
MGENACNWFAEPQTTPPSLERMGCLVEALHPSLSKSNDNSRQDLAELRLALDLRPVSPIQLLRAGPKIQGTWHRMNERSTLRTEVQEHRATDKADQGTYSPGERDLPGNHEAEVVFMFLGTGRDPS